MIADSEKMKPPNTAIMINAAAMTTDGLLVKNGHHDEQFGRVRFHGAESAESSGGGRCGLWRSPAFPRGAALACLPAPSRPHRVQAPLTRVGPESGCVGMLDDYRPAIGSLTPRRSKVGSTCGINASTIWVTAASLRCGRPRMPSVTRAAMVTYAQR